MAGYIGSKSSVTLVDGYTEAEADAEFVTKTGDTMTGDLTVGGNILVEKTGNPTITNKTTGAGNNPSYRLQADTNYWDFQGTFSNANDELFFMYNGSPKMGIDSSGNVLVGKDSANPTIAGVAIEADGDAYFTAEGANGRVLYANRLSSDGDIMQFAKDTATVGSIGAYSGDLYVVNGGGVGAGLRYNSGFPNILPCNGTGADRDNAIDLGASGVRFDDIYATNGTIQTSDFNEKQDIASLTATEMLVGKRISTLFKTFRWKDSVAEKGDNARTHTGVIAQDVQSAFTAEGLDAGDYALFISSTWWETQTEVPAVEAVAEVEAVTETTTDEDGNEVVTVITEAVEAVEAVDAYTRTDTYETEAEAPEGATEKTRLGIRYPELLSFVAAYNEQRFASIEARLTALEA